MTFVRFKEEKKIRHPHPHPPPPPNKKIISALKSEILIKYKRVNQMDPTREALRLFASQGDNYSLSYYCARTPNPNFGHESPIVETPFWIKKDTNLFLVKKNKQNTYSCGKIDVV